MIRQAIHDAYCINLRSPGDIADSMLAPGAKRKGTGNIARAGTNRGAKKSNNGLIAMQVEAGKIIAAVESLPPVEQAWIKWCYGPTLEDSIYKAFDLKQRFKEVQKELKRYKRLEKKLGNDSTNNSVTSLLQLEDVKAQIAELEAAEQEIQGVYDSMQIQTAPELFGWIELALECEFKRLGARKVPVKTHDRIKSAAVYWVVNYRQQFRNGMTVFSKEEISEFTGVSSNNYSSRLGQWENFIEQLCEQLDLMTLTKIENISKKINKAA